MGERNRLGARLRVGWIIGVIALALAPLLAEAGTQSCLGAGKRHRSGTVDAPL